MAGRGTDIARRFARGRARNATRRPATRSATKREWQKRHDTVPAASLHIIGTERHEARRIDNQLRGRAGRQGDPGSSRFYLSLEDSLMRITLHRLGDPLDAAVRHEGTRGARRPHDHCASSRSRSARSLHNFDIRKQLLEFDDTANTSARSCTNSATSCSTRTTWPRTSRTSATTSSATLVAAASCRPTVVDEQDVAGLEALQQYGFQFELKRWLESQHEADSDDLRAITRSVQWTASSARRRRRNARRSCARPKAFLQVLDQQLKRTSREGATSCSSRCSSGSRPM